MTKKEMVINQLEEVGYVSRNWALDNRITRLAAIMCDLKDWYDFTTKQTKDDYFYIAIY